MSEKPIDDATGTETTGHEWDGIKELNTPLPRWWLWTFYATIAFAVVYTVLYPAWPLIGSATTGVLGFSTRGDLQLDIATAKQAQAVYANRIAATPVAEILDNPDLTRFARSAGQSLFKVNCAQCHGAGAAGGHGYPNLNDDDWLWGGSIDQIYATITHGARFAPDADTHATIMPIFAGALETDQIRTIAQEVASFSGLEGGADTAEGRSLFSDNCASCHGDTGQGSLDVGADRKSVV